MALFCPFFQAIHFLLRLDPISKLIIDIVTQFHKSQVNAMHGKGNQMTSLYIAAATLLCSTKLHVILDSPAHQIWIWLHFVAHQVLEETLHVTVSFMTASFDHTVLDQE